MEAYAQFKFNLKGWWLRGKAGLLQNYTFLKKDGPVQAEKEFFLVNVVGGKSLRIGKYIGMDNLLMFAYSSAPEYLHVPLFSMQENVYGIIPIKDIAEVQVGVEVMYNTSYYADAYSPATTSYYWQDEVKRDVERFLEFQGETSQSFCQGGEYSARTFRIQLYSDPPLSVMGSLRAFRGILAFLRLDSFTAGLEFGSLLRIRWNDFLLDC